MGLKTCHSITITLYAFVWLAPDVVAIQHREYASHIYAISNLNISHSHTFSSRVPPFCVSLSAYSSHTKHRMSHQSQWEVLRAQTCINIFGIRLNHHRFLPHVNYMVFIAFHVFTQYIIVIYDILQYLAYSFIWLWSSSLFNQNTRLNTPLTFYLYFISSLFNKKQ